MLADLLLISVLPGAVEHRSHDLVGQVLLLDVVPRKVMCVLISDPAAERLMPVIVRVLQVRRDGLYVVLADVAVRLVDGDHDGIALRGAGDVDRGVREDDARLRKADALHLLIGKRKPFLTAKRILSNQTFRDLYKADNLSIDQRLKITSLTFLFTDLKGSTALYERVGDLAAFDLVRAHFHALLDIIAAEGGAVVKTIGDSVMATFTHPEQALLAAIEMRKAMERLNDERETRDLVVKIGIHEGPCLAVMLNERQDYFGQTVNIAARVQSLSTAEEIHITGPVLDAPAVAEVLNQREIKPIQKQAALRGIADKMVVYEIP